MNINELKSIWQAEEQAAFSGWDFSHLDGRWKEEPLSWDYGTLLSNYLKPHLKLLDMGTGGGEFLLTLKHTYQNTSVTESWEPNNLLCKERLEPLGICVKKVTEDTCLPFDDNTFDIIINRHESYHLPEIKRICKPNGLFITQQVGGSNDNDLSQRLIDHFSTMFPDFDLAHQRNAFLNYDFDILFQKEEFKKTYFYDVGAVVYFVKILPWEFPGFSVDSAFEALLQLHSELLSKGYIAATTHRFVLIAQNLK